MTRAKPYKVFWTDIAEKTASDIVKYLLEEWTEKEVNVFLDEVDRVIDAIEIYPKLFKPSTKRKNVHLALISKHTFLVYQVRPTKGQIILLLFWDTRQNPKKFKY
jgi:hypothetical protein